MKRALMSKWIRSLPLVGRAMQKLRHGQPSVPFEGSADYWRRRYAAGGDSGVGSYGKFAEFKARVLNGLFAELAIDSVIEFGCGDGNQLALLKVPSYLGVDVSIEAVARCRARFADVPGRHFLQSGEYSGEQADCALSLDVIYHLVEDGVFSAYMRQLFGASRLWVVIYSSNVPEVVPGNGEHVRHRKFTDWVAAQEPAWTLWRHVPNDYPYRGDWREGSFADFYVFRRVAEAK